MAGKQVKVFNSGGGEVATYSNAKIVIEGGMLYVKDADSEEVLWVSNMSEHRAQIVQ